MPYATVDNIKKYFQGLKFETGSDNLTKEDIEDFILNESSIIDAFLSNRYKLPITDTRDLIFLKSLCEKMVVSIIDGILRDDTEDQFSRSRGLRAEIKNIFIKLNGDPPLLNSPIINNFAGSFSSNKAFK